MGPVLSYPSYFALPHLPLPSYFAPLLPLPTELNPQSSHTRPPTYSSVDLVAEVDPDHISRWCMSGFLSVRG